MKKQIVINNVVVTGLLASLSMLTACDLKTAVAPKDPVKAISLKTFPRESVLLTNNMLFVWPETITATQMKNVMAIGDRIDQLDADAAPINQRLQVLREHLAQLEDQIFAKNRLLNSQKSKIRRKEAELKKAQATHDANLIATIQGQLDVMVRDKEEIERQIADLQNNADFQEKGNLEASRRRGQDEGNQLVGNLAATVSLYYPAPTAFNFQFRTNGTVDIAIADWKMDRDEDPKTFSTQSQNGLAPTITNVVYTEVGGEFQFDVYDYWDAAQTNLRGIYSFKISRSKYSANDDRIYFSGELTQKLRQPDGSFVPHKGAVKLIDRH